MRIAVLASQEQWNELMNIQSTATCIRVNNVMDDPGSVDAWLVTTGTQQLPAFEDKPLLVHAVAGTHKSLRLPTRAVRINAWAGFLSRECWELSGNITEDALEVVNALGREPIVVADEPGFVAGRVLAMIINEAYFALGENVSTREEIDTAMKLGTNYPLGPFEWAQKIGLQEIRDLLIALEPVGKRYNPAPLLMQESLS